MRDGGRDQPAADRRRAATQLDASTLPRRAAAGRRRRRAAGAGVRQPAQQRRQVHRRRAAASGIARARATATAPWSACATTASASPPRCCRASSTCSCRSSAAHDRAAGRAGHRPDAGAQPGRDARRQRRRRTATAPGRGSEFVVRLPLARSAGDRAPRRDGAAPPASRWPAARAGRRRQPRRRRQPGRAAASCSAPRCASRTTARRRSRRSREFRPDVVLLDIGMPGMDGYEVARRMRARPDATRGTLLIALTGWGQDEDRAPHRARPASTTTWSSRPTSPRCTRCSPRYRSGHPMACSSGGPHWRFPGRADGRLRRL